MSALLLALALNAQAQDDPCGTRNPKPGVKNQLQAEYFAAFTIGPLPPPRSQEEARARGLNQQASNFERAGQPAQAIPLLEQAIPMFQRSVGDLDPVTPAAMRRLANDYRAMGRSKEALTIHRRAYELRNRICRPNNAWALESLVDVALTYSELGRPIDALPALEFVERQFRGNLDDDFPIAQQAIRALALTYATMGRPADALPLVERLLKRPRALASPTTLSDLAAVYSKLGRIRESAALYERVLELEKQAGQGKQLDLLTTKNNLAILYTQSGQHERALPFEEEAVQGALRVYGESHPTTLAFMHNLAGNYVAVKRLPDARRVAEHLYSLEVRVHGAQHPSALRAAFVLADIQAEQGEVAAARPLLTRTLAAQKSVMGANHPDTLSTASLLAALTFDSGDCAGAIPLASLAVTGSESVRAAGDLSEENRRSLFQQWVPSYKLLAACYAQTGKLDEAFRTLELVKSRTLLESTALASGVRSSTLPESEREHMAQYQRRIAALTEAIARTDKDTLRITLEADKDALVREAATFRRALADRYPKFRELTEIHPIERAQLSARLPSDTILVSYAAGRKAGFALLLARDRIVLAQLPDITGLREVAELYLQILRERSAAPPRIGADFVWTLPSGGFAQGRAAPASSARRVDNVNEIGDWLARRLLAPVMAHIKGSPHLVIVPDGALAFLPFETLPVDGKPLIAKADVSYAESGSLYALMLARQDNYRHLSDRKDLFAMGAAIYEDAANGASTPRPAQPGDAAQLAVNSNPDSVQRALRALELRWANLPGTEREVDGVSALFSGAVKFKGRDASEATLQRLDRDGSLAHFRYLLFSAHGYLSVGEPALSAVVLSQIGNPPGIDGYVTAAEWPTYTLRSDLVVLSACETGRGTLVAGDGVLGLPYAFYAAGNTSTVMTLWPVYDASSAVFMQRLFARLRKGESAVAALGAVKREFLAASPTAAEPVFWAPYVLYGI